jgi:hypothetical protein
MDDATLLVDVSLVPSAYRFGSLHEFVGELEADVRNAIILPMNNRPCRVARVYHNPSSVSASSYHPASSFSVNHNPIPVVPFLV